MKNDSWKMLSGLVLLLVIALCGSTAHAFCYVGQVWPGFDPEWIEPGAIAGDGETFFALVDPTAGCDCPVGFELTTMEVYLTVADDLPVPFTVTVSMGLSEAVADPDGLLPWLPGALICATPVRDFTFYVPKDFVGFGIALECDCRTMEEPYFLSFTIHSVMDPPGGLYTTGGGKPESGRFLTRIDGQWVDLVAAGVLTRGDLVLSASARCCETPVSASARSWSGIKALYR